MNLLKLIWSRILSAPPLVQNRNLVFHLSQDNINLFLDYVIDETKAKDILLGLTVTDFSEVRHNEHKGYEHELLYVFGKDVELLERTGNKSKTVSLYIKFNMIYNKNSPTSSGSEMNCRFEHKCS